MVRLLSIIKFFIGAMVFLIRLKLADDNGQKLIKLL
jgi:hypothetical protein